MLKPIGIPVLEFEEIVMSFDEFEAVRLADLEGLYQERPSMACAHLSAKAGWVEECGVDRWVADGRLHAPEGSTRGGHR